ncbi:MAG: hypothetical protein M0021_09955 [Clostridia bacterium]|nr:hypothetical protein [Clostridia bacterium]
MGKHVWEGVVWNKEYPESNCFGVEDEVRKIPACEFLEEVGLSGKRVRITVEVLE